MRTSLAYARRTAAIAARAICIVALDLSVAMGETPTTGIRPVPVAPGPGSSGFGYYGTCPESPDGKRIAYVRLGKKLYKNSYEGALYTCDRDLKKHVKLYAISKTGYHNTACPLWVDSRLLAFQVHLGSTDVIDVRTGKVRWGPLDGKMNHNAFKGRILLSSDERENNLGQARGLYEFDCYSGAKRLIVSHDALIERFRDHFKDPGEARGKFKIQHAMYAPDGKTIAIKFLNSNAKEHPLITFRTDGTDIILFGMKKPMHFQWYDNETVFGHDSEVEGSPNDNYLKRWDRRGKLIEVLAGAGCHPAMSPDQKWIATESWYGSRPVVLRLYRRGHTEPAAVLMNAPHSGPVWDLRAHVNPSFSRDGKRVYFNRPVTDEESRAYYVDISGI